MSTLFVAAISPFAFVAARADDGAMSTTTDTPHPPTQLRLIDGGAADRDWLLDERTRRAGRYGVSQVRETLRKASPPQPNERTGPAGHPVAC